jgi:hypothetical protein
MNTNIQELETEIIEILSILNDKHKSNLISKILYPGPFYHEFGKKHKGYSVPIYNDFINNESWELRDEDNEYYTCKICGYNYSIENVREDIIPLILIETSGCINKNNYKCNNLTSLSFELISNLSDNEKLFIPWAINLLNYYLEDKKDNIFNFLNELKYTI